MSSPPTILVFDSGLGGLTVLREIVGARPDAHYVYVADDGSFPMATTAGRSSPRGAAGRRVDRAPYPGFGGDCPQHASTLVMSHLRRLQRAVRWHRAAIKPACASSKTKRVSVLGTKGTVKREYTRRLIDDFARLRNDAGGIGELASLAESALGSHDVRDGYRRRARPALSEWQDRTDTKSCWPAPTIRCCSTG